MKSVGFWVEKHAGGGINSSLSSSSNFVKLNYVQMSIKVMLRTAVAFAVPFTGTSTGVVEFVEFEGSEMLYKIRSQSISS